MPELSAKPIVILAALCFLGLVGLQIAWMRSAYQGELALYTREKRQFESALQASLKENETFKSGLKSILDEYTKNKTVDPSKRAWFAQTFDRAASAIIKERQHDIFISNFGVIQHNARPGGSDFVVFKDSQRASGAEVEKAGRLCVHCLLGLSTPVHHQYDYHLLVLYGREQSRIYDRLAFLIGASFILLLLLVLLFSRMLKKYRQERKLSESKNDFINNLSHEIQTPVFAIQMANKLIREKTGDREETTPLTEIIEKETYQLKQHARKILELASLENEQLELHLQRRDLNEFILDKVPTLQIMVANKKGELITHLHNQPVVANIDTTLLNSVLVSLTENAIKYSHSAPCITITTGVMNNMISVRVKDNGIGIKKEYQPYVFDKFFRVPATNGGNVKGFGLGLSYVKQIILLHKGSVHISSEHGAGTTVTILIPKYVQDINS
ncbi:MAG TPA: HAMP domain-containing sensor histidine kinase [Chitinophagaceae bacterium]|nr:HAMP domain-containing sensor histidine kinase [Chitinophagaceae bacterium]